MSATHTPNTALPGGAATLIDAIQRLSLARSMHDIQAVVRTCARRLTGADGATLVLRDDPYCFYADEDAISPLWKGQRFPQETCISGWVMNHGQVAVVEDIYRDGRIPHDAYRPTFVKSLVMVPIRAEDPLGAIGNYWAHRRRPTDDEVKLLAALADSTAVAMENVRVLQELEARVADRSAELRARAERHLTVLNSLAHEVRTPLAAAAGMLELVMTGGHELDQSLRTDIELSRASIDEALRIVSDQLDRARLETGSLPLDPADVDLGRELSVMSESLRGLAASDVSLVAEPPAEQVVVRTDPVLLGHVLRNLAGNALKFTDEGEVRLRARGLSGGAEIDVADTGLGIAPEDHERIFQPWVQIDDAQAGRSPGTGLGLPLVRELVERLGGTISLHSAPDSGSTFTVRLPAAPPSR